MSFSNQKSSLITDSQGNIYNFLWDNEELIYISFNKKTGKSQRKVIIEGCRIEFDTIIDEKDMIYLICQKKNGSILLLTLFEGNWETSVLVDEGAEVIYNLSIETNSEMIHIIYCLYSNESENLCRIYHHFYNGKEWVTNILEDIRKREILNHFQILKLQENLILGYYNLEQNQEQIYIKTFNFAKQIWSKGIQITNSPNYKLYLDILATNKDELHINYSEYIDGNLLIKYEKHRLLEDSVEKLCESTLSNPANCSYPTLVAYKNKLWSLWTEYDYLASCFSTDSGESWSNPYMWSSSKKSTIIRYKFSSNQREIKGVYKLNHSFGKNYPDIEFIGFGSLKNASEMPLMSKKKEENIEDTKKDEEKGEVLDLSESGDIMRSYIKKKKSGLMKERAEKTADEEVNEALKKIELDIGRLKNHIRDLEDRVGNLEGTLMSKDYHSFKEMEKRIDEIENHISRRRRGPLFGPRE